MLYKRRKSDQNFFAFVMIALIFLAVSACKKGSPVRQEIPKEDEYITYYKNFKIEGIGLSRVSMEDVPSKGYALYLLEAYTLACNPEVIKIPDPPVMGPIWKNCQEGSVTPVYNIVFKNRYGKDILPKPLRWSEKGDRVSCNLSISKKNSNRSKWGYYNGDYKELPLDLMRPMIFSRQYLTQERNEGIRDTLFYLISFDSKRTLPDSVIVVFPDRDLKAAVNNSKKREYTLDYHTEFVEALDIVLSRKKNGKKNIPNPIHEIYEKYNYVYEKRH
ncbi:MAG: hypothetical protein ACI4TK_11745 [Agathobacter sp.]